MILNEIVLKVTEVVSGQKMPVRLGNFAGVSERTLRNGNLTDKTINKIQEGAKNNIRNKLRALEWSEQEIDKIIINYPQSLCAGLIYECQIPDELEFPKSIELAIQCDEIGFSLLDARKQNNLEKFRNEHEIT